MPKSERICLYGHEKVLKRMIYLKFVSELALVLDSP